MKRKITLIVFLIVLLTSILPSIAGTSESGAPASKPVLVSQPKDQQVREKGKCHFEIGETGATGITWRFYDPETEEEVLASQASSYFRGLKVTGSNSDDLRLSNVPSSLDGWQVYCTLVNKKGSVATRYAELIVTDKQGNRFREYDSWDNEDVPSAAVSFSRASDWNGDEIVIDVIGGYLQKSGSSAHYDTLSFDGAANFKVAANTGSIDYWVINGVRYDFVNVPKSITVEDLWESTTFEIVYKKKSSQTLLSAEEIQEGRTGDPLIVSAVNAKMCHIKNKSTGAGGYFTEFDFTEDYQNRASKKKENGGQVTVKVIATIPKGKKVSAWRFDDARFTFSTNVEYFFARGLNVSKEYEPLFGAVKTTKKPSKVTNTPHIFNGNGNYYVIVTATPGRRPPAPGSSTRVTPTPAYGSRPSPVTATPAYGSRPSRVTATPARSSDVRPSGSSSGGTIVRVTPTPAPTPRRVLTPKLPIVNREH